MFALLLVAVAFGAGHAPAMAADEPLRVVLVGQQQDARIAEVVAAVKDALATPCQDCGPGVTLAFREPDMEQLKGIDSRADLVVAIGSPASKAVVEAGVSLPTLFSFIPRTVWREITACCLGEDRRATAIFLDQPLRRHIELITLVVPGAKRVGVLLGPGSAERRQALRRVTAEYGLQLLEAEIEAASELGSQLRVIARDSDVLLALPDPLVYNRNTVYSILLTTYSARIPVIGYSDALVKAGAAAAVYYSPDDVGKDAAERIRTFQSTGRLPPASFGDNFSVSVNRDVIRSLHLPSTSETNLLRRLESVEP